MVGEYVDCRFEKYHLKARAGCCPEPFLEVCCGQGGAEARTGWEPVYSSSYTVVSRFQWEGQTYYHKRYLERGWLEIVKAWFLGCRAERALRGGRLLEQNALATPEVVLAGWRGAECFAVTRAAVAAKLTEYVAGLKERTDSSARHAMRRVADELARMVGRMHARGIVHGDLRWSNILVEEVPEGLRFVLLDNERTRRYRLLPTRKRVKNLVQLNMIPRGLSVSRTERMRFWRAYRAENGVLRMGHKQLARRVLARTAWRLAEQAKRKGL